LVAATQQLDRQEFFKIQKSRKSFFEKEKFISRIPFALSKNPSARI